MICAVESDSGDRTYSTTSNVGLVFRNDDSEEEGEYIFFPHIDLKAWSVCCQIVRSQSCRPRFQVPVRQQWEEVQSIGRRKLPYGCEGYSFHYIKDASGVKELRFFIAKKGATSRRPSLRQTTFSYLTTSARTS